MSTTIQLSLKSEHLLVLVRLLPLIIAVTITLINWKAISHWFRSHLTFLWRITIVLLFVGGLVYNAVLIGEHFRPKMSSNQTISSNQKWRDDNFPGKWQILYDEVYNVKCWESKILAIEQFCEVDAASQPKLPVHGFDCLVILLWDSGCSAEYQWQQISRARDACRTHLVALPAWADQWYAEKRMEALTNKEL